MTMHRHFEEQIDQVKSHLVRMGSTAERMIERAVRSLVDRDEGMHADVFRDEESVNLSHLEIDESVIEILALQHPVAADLRMVVMCSRIAGDLERVGDQAVNICQNTAVFLKFPPFKPLIDIPLMADAARGMLRDVLDAFVRKDAALAQAVLDKDDVVDAFKDQIFRELLTYMMSEPATIPKALPLILISRNLERVGDHAANIAEEVIYVAEGRDVRHHHEQVKRQENAEGK